MKGSTFQLLHILDPSAYGFGNDLSPTCAEELWVEIGFSYLKGSHVIIMEKEGASGEKWCRTIALYIGSY